MDDSWFEDHKKLSEDEKRVLYNELKKFDEYGKAVYQEKDLRKIAKKFAAITEYAKRYLNEKENSFDSVTVNRNLKEIEKKVRKFKKEADKVQKHQDRLTALYDDIGMKFNRYFDVGGAEEGKSDTINESVQVTETQLRGLVREELKGILSEQRVEFDRQKMLNLADKDKFIRHVIRDESRDPQDPSNHTLRTIFNGYVLGDSQLERKYQQTQSR